jgi:hypothetical protein
MKSFAIEAKRGILLTKGMFIVFGLVFISTSPFVSAQGNGRGNGRGSGNSIQQRGKGSQSFENHSLRQAVTPGNPSMGGNLTPAQVEQLVRMREEEKLAHDVYVTLAKSSGLQIFNKIANSESQHMRAVEQLASRYSSVAATSLPVGSFSDPQLQALYNSLVAIGSKSSIAAATVGAKIEEMDIRDLQTLLSQNPPQDISKVLEHLQRASEQHLRAFTTELKQLGGRYSPEFLSPQEYNRILDSENERGQGMAKGSEKGMHHERAQAGSIDPQWTPQSQKGNGKRGAGRK